MILLLAIWILANMIGIFWEVVGIIDGDRDIIFGTLLNDELNWFGRIFTFILALVFCTIPTLFVLLCWGIGILFEILCTK